MKNYTRSTLENLEYTILNTMTEAMYSILDNGDRPDIRIDAIVGLHMAKKAILEKLDKTTLSIPDRQ